MPCYQVRYQSVEFTAENIEALRKAAAVHGWTVLKEADGLITVKNRSGSIITIRDGVATGQVTQINQLRVSYSQEILNIAAVKAKAAGWNVKKVNNKLEIWK